MADATPGPGARSSLRGSRTVVLTRPAGQSNALAAALLRQGWQVCDWPALLLTGLPALDVPVPDAFELVVFVSGNAVRFYSQQLACVGATQTDWPDGVPTATVGLGSARAVHECFGSTVRVIHPPAEAPAFDSEALWAELERQGLAPTRVLIVRGGQGAEGQGRNWLAGQFARSGAEVTLHAAYRRAAAVWPAQRLDQMRAWQEHGVRPAWLISSREGLEAVLAQAGERAVLAGWQGARVLAPHPRIAQAIASRAASCGIATRQVSGPAPEPDPQAIMIQTCMPHDEAVLEAIVN